MPFGTIISVEVVRDSTGAPQVRCRGACGCSQLVALSVQAAGFAGCLKLLEKQACTPLWPAGVVIMLACKSATVCNLQFR